jgi:hypothetical protein
VDDVVILTGAESRICRWVGRQRFEDAVSKGRKPGAGPSMDAGSAWHIRGAHCEYAASLVLNLFWRPKIGEVDGRDVGGLVEVRSGVSDRDRLIVKPKDDPEAPFVLVIAEMEFLEFAVVGWMFGANAKSYQKIAYEGCDPAHYVPQGDLWPIAQLRKWLCEKRLA